jgi:hypothetical protein
MRNVGVGNLELIGCHQQAQFSVDAYHIHEKMPGSATGAADFPQKDYALLMASKRSIGKESPGHWRTG